MKIRLFLLTSVAFCLFATHSQATELGFFVGGLNPGAISFQSITTSLDRSPIFGLRLANYFVPHFGMEHTLAFSSDYLVPRSISAIKDAKGFVYNSNLIINIPLKVVTPYLTAGAGLLHQYGDSNLPVGTKFAFNYGGGIKFSRIAGPLGLRFDVRGYSAKLFSDKLNILEVSGGIMLSSRK